MEELSNELKVILAKAVCKNISCKEIHEIIDEIFCEFVINSSDDD